MERPYRMTNLAGVMAIGKEIAQDPSPSEYGQFDADKYFVTKSIPNKTIFFPWEWIYMPDIVEYAKECGIKIPDGAIDYRKIF